MKGIMKNVEIVETKVEINNEEKQLLNDCMKEADTLLKLLNKSTGDSYTGEVDWKQSVKSHFDDDLPSEVWQKCWKILYDASQKKDHEKFKRISF